ncbi:MAG: biotin--[acetyl-CoA-carboxylase] ligase [Acutalibacteraceae bacterium]|nr:biotin--[acetyl-CoA-carboxylase] ligase [Acutalibacteraceae bacterium]
MSEINLIYFDTIPSTNTYAKENINTLILPSLIIANGQTAGRGRQGKSFYSPNDTGLYMTLLFEAPQNCSLLTPLAAVSVCEVLSEYQISPKIKWVNDIFLDNKKICGILTECFSYKNKLYIALGIGINITTSEFPADLDIAGSAKIICDKKLLALQISNRILEHINCSDNQYIINEYRKYLFVIGKRISYFKKNTEYTATVTDINEQCNLIVSREDGSTDILSSGEISIKL